MHSTILKTSVFLLLTLGACGPSAVLVRKDTHGGRVALQGASYMITMSRGRLLMAEHCGGRFYALEQGERVEFRCQSAAALALVKPGH
jgi:hypothetical protein